MPGSGPLIQLGSPCQLAGIRPDGPAAACRQSATPAATNPASASGAPTTRRVRAPGRAIRVAAGAAILRALYPDRTLEHVLRAQPRLGAAEAPLPGDPPLVAQPPARPLRRGGAAPRPGPGPGRAHL